MVVSRPPEGRGEEAKGTMPALAPAAELGAEEEEEEETEADGCARVTPRIPSSVSERLASGGVSACCCWEEDGAPLPAAAGEGEEGGGCRAWWLHPRRMLFACREG